MFKHLLSLLSLMATSSVTLAQTHTGTPIDVAVPGVNCVQPDAWGDGSHDDTTAIRNALALARIGMRAVCVQPGAYKYTGDIVIPSRVSIYGLSGGIGGGVRMLPVNGARFVIDGTQIPDGVVIRSTMSNLNFELTAGQTQPSSVIDINVSYSLTFDHIAIFNGQLATTAALNINSVNTFLCNFCVVWGNQGAPTGTGVLISGGGPAAIQMNSMNIEGFDVGMRASGSTELTMVQPWFEKNTHGYVHNLPFASGSTQITGGIFSIDSGATGIEVPGDHLLVQGTLFSMVPGAYGIALTNSWYSDVQLSSIPNISATNMFAPGANVLGVRIDPPPVRHLTASKIHFTKQVTSGAATDILSLNSIPEFARFRLTLTAFGGNGFQTKQYDFGVTAYTQVGNLDPIVTPLSTFANGNWDLRITALQLVPNGTSLTVRVTATAGGTFGAGGSPTMIGELEMLNFAPGTATGSVNIL